MNHLSNYWDSKHIFYNTSGNIHMLTDSCLRQVSQDLCLYPFIRAGIKILMVGVGTGRDSLELVKKGCIVDSYDISKVALSRVLSFVRKAYLPVEHEHIPRLEYNLIISHFVAQHMSDEDLKMQINSLMPCLKDSGVFAMQFATVKGSKNQSIAYQQGGGCSRTLKDLISFFPDFKVDLVKTKKHSETVDLNYVHIRKKE